MHEPEWLEHLTTQMLHAIQGQHAILRHELAKTQMDVSEQDFAPAITVLTVKPQSQNPERITRVVLYVGTGNGLLELGGTQIPINGTPEVVNLRGRWVLEATDTRTLSSVTLAAGVPGARGSGGATFLYLGLFGEEIPRGGMRF